jgi:hypothetical protein
MRLGFRTKVFIASVAASAVSLAALTVLFSWQARAEQRTAIERRLTDEVRLIADLLATTTTADEAGLDREADRLGGWSRPTAASWATRHSRRRNCRPWTITPPVPRCRRPVAAPSA